MCKSEAEGGKRCASHTRAALEAAQVKLKAAENNPAISAAQVGALKRKVSTAMADYASTPAGLGFLNGLIAMKTEGSPEHQKLLKVKEKAMEMRRVSNLKVTAIRNFNREKEAFMARIIEKNERLISNPPARSPYEALIPMDTRSAYQIALGRALLDKGHPVVRWLPDQYEHLSAEDAAAVGYSERSSDRVTAGGRKGYSSSYYGAYPMDAVADQHMRTCGVIDIEGLEESTYDEFAGSFAEPEDRTNACVSGNVTCSCGEVYRRFTVYKGSVGELIRAVTNQTEY